MFSKDVIGTASAMMGNTVDIGVTQVLMGTILFPLLKNYVFNGDSELAWRTAPVFPAIICFVTGLYVLYCSDDTPQGNISTTNSSLTTTQYDGTRMMNKKVSASRSFRKAAMNVNSWILFCQYSCSVGASITMYNLGALYFTDTFGLSTSSSSAIFSIYGWIEPFGTVVGAYLSDKFAQKYQLLGRLFVLMAACSIQGTLFVLFSSVDSLPVATILLVVLALAGGSLIGSLFAIVQFVDPTITGSIEGIAASSVGVGGIGLDRKSVV